MPLELDDDVDDDDDDDEPPPAPPAFSLEITSLGALIKEQPAARRSPLITVVPTKNQSLFMRSSYQHSSRFGRHHFRWIDTNVALHLPKPDDAQIAALLFDADLADRPKLGARTHLDTPNVFLDVFGFWHSPERHAVFAARNGQVITRAEFLEVPTKQRHEVT
jgi:hypothetical protein